MQGVLMMQASTGAVEASTAKAIWASGVQQVERSWMRRSIRPQLLLQPTRQGPSLCATAMHSPVWANGTTGYTKLQVDIRLQGIAGVYINCIDWLHVHTATAYMQRCVELSSFGTSKENTCSLAFALHPTPAGLHKLTVELGLPQTLVDGIVRLAHPLPQLWASLRGRCMVPAFRMGT